MVKIRTGGLGRQGYCKLCSFDDPDFQHDFDVRVNKKWSQAKINEWLAQYELPGISRTTLYNHRQHVANPKDRLVTAITKRAAEQPQLPATVSEDQFLEAVVSQGYRRVAEDPDSVTIDQALKAAQIRANLQKKGQSINVLVGVFGGGASMTQEPPVIEGQVREV